MERIQLTRTEKVVLRFAALGGAHPDTISPFDYTMAVNGLIRKGLAKIDDDPDMPVCSPKCELTECGRVYLAENPALRNPINWPPIYAAISVFSAIVSLMAVLWKRGII